MGKMSINDKIVIQNLEMKCPLKDDLGELLPEKNRNHSTYLAHIVA